MERKRLNPRETLAKNLRALIAKSGMSPPQVAKLARVDPKTLNNQLNGRFDPRYKLVDAVASVFGIEGWQLLRPGFNPDESSDGQLRQLLLNFDAADAPGRLHIAQAAEFAVRAKGNA
jgi:transcriptional regulator with XRE-family HTH domain